MPAPAESVARADETALPGAVVFPSYEAESDLQLESVGRGPALMQMADNSLNYSLLGRRGFETLAQIAETVPSYALRYASLSDALARLSREMRS